jgi:hypothetical protein
MLRYEWRLVRDSSLALRMTVWGFSTSHFHYSLFSFNIPNSAIRSPRQSDGLAGCRFGAAGNPQ